MARRLIHTGRGLKEEIVRASRKRFECYITGLDGEAQNPNGGCWVRLEKTGDYTYGSPSQWYPCSNTGTTGYWGADVYIDPSWTLGDYIARFRWIHDGEPDGQTFEYTLVRMDKPFDSSREEVP